MADFQLLRVGDRVVVNRECSIKRIRDAEVPCLSTYGVITSVNQLSERNAQTYGEGYRHYYDVKWFPSEKMYDVYAAEVCLVVPKYIVVSAVEFDDVDAATALAELLAKQGDIPMKVIHA